MRFKQYFCKNYNNLDLNIKHKFLIEIDEDSCSLFITYKKNRNNPIVSAYTFDDKLNLRTVEFAPYESEKIQVLTYNEFFKFIIKKMIEMYKEVLIDQLNKYLNSNIDGEVYIESTDKPSKA